MYDYEQLKNDIELLKEAYPAAEVFSIGKSVKGRELYTVKLGHGKKTVYYIGAHHGMEWITSKLLMKYIFDVYEAQKNGMRLKNIDIDNMFDAATVYITPMLNPDGVELSKTNKGWQANANGVDLNHNYDAMWRRGKLEIAREGISGPGPTKYSGRYPESEPESKAAASFSRNHRIDYAVAFHSQGEVIYWRYGSNIPKGSRTLAEKMAELSGYELSQTEGTASYSGYKDWFIKAFNRPAFTVEVGRGTNPLSEYQLPKIYNNMLELLLLPGV